MADRTVAVLDADVLVPILSCDLLLSAFDHDIYRPVVGPTILDEVARNLHSNFSHLASSAVDRRVGQVRAALAMHTHDPVPPTDAVDIVNAKDRHVALVALATNANVVVTNDQRLRSQLGRLTPSMVALSADDFAVALQRSSPTGMRTVIESMAGKRHRPPVTVEQMVEQLLPSFPAFIEEWKSRPT